MKKLLLIIAGIAIATTSFAQKCKYQKNELDPITRKTIKITDVRVLTTRATTSKNIVAAVAQKNSDSIFLTLGLTIQSNITCDLTAKKGSKATLLFDDESTLEIGCFNDYKGALFSQQNAGNFQYGIELHYFISTETLSKIINKKVKMIRIEADRNKLLNQFDADVKEKNMSVISDILKCVM
jgi:hypothetical protein